MLRIVDEGACVRLVLARPEARNALAPPLMQALRQAFADLSPQVRVVVFEGDGKIFCAGADLQYMRDCGALSHADNAADAQALAALFAIVDAAPQVVIARVQGAALGGGLGLVACCDVVVCADDAKFGFTEVRLGLVPAVIAPFALRKIGMSAARRWFLTGALFGAAEARQIGLVHEVVPTMSLDVTVARLRHQVLNNGPQALRAAKALLRTLPELSAAQTLAHTTELIATLRRTDEAQAGLEAFLQKQRPPWAAS